MEKRDPRQFLRRLVSFIARRATDGFHQELGEEEAYDVIEGHCFSVCQRFRDRSVHQIFLQTQVEMQHVIPFQWLENGPGDMSVATGIRYICCEILVVEVLALLHEKQLIRKPKPRRLIRPAKVLPFRALPKEA